MNVVPDTADPLPLVAEAESWVVDPRLFNVAAPGLTWTEATLPSTPTPSSPPPQDATKAAKRRHETKRMGEDGLIGWCSGRDGISVGDRPTYAGVTLRENPRTGRDKLENPEAGGLAAGPQPSWLANTRALLSRGVSVGLAP